MKRVAVAVLLAAAAAAGVAAWVLTAQPEWYERLRYPLDPATFMNRWCEEGPTHHVALGVGHQAGRIEKLARLLGLELVVVTRQ